MSNHEDMLSAALKYAARGWKVFPLWWPVNGVCQCKALNCSRAGKHPIVTRNFEHGLKSATTDPKLIEQAWTKYPEANIGCRMGKESGLFLLDVDDTETFYEFLAAHGYEKIQRTLRARSGRTETVGEHYYFKYPGFPVKSAPMTLFKKADLKGDGGYAIMPPSVHESCQSYMWIYHDDPIQAPFWLLEYIQNGSRNSAKEKSTPESKAPGVDISLDGPPILKADPSRNVEIHAICGKLRGMGHDDNFIIDYVSRLNENRCDPPLTNKELETTINSALKYKPNRDTLKPLISIEDGEIHLGIDACEQVIANLNEPIYQRGQMLVRPARTQEAGKSVKGVIRAKHSCYLEEVTNDFLVDRLSQIATFVRHTSSGPVFKDCPKKFAQGLLARTGAWSRLKVLAGIVEIPTLRLDGTILSKEGFDSKSGLILDSGGLDFGEMPHRPSPQDSKEAKDNILSYVETFPFVSSYHKSVWFAALLTAVIRPSLLQAPLFLFSSPTAGTGKSLLVDLIGLISTGKPVATYSLGGQDELGKRLGASLLAGDQIVSLDNIQRILQNDDLCSMLTQSMIRVRVLGKSKSVVCPSRITVCATGNNLCVMKDLERRCLMCRLDAGCERPELREFDKNPYQEVLRDRIELVRNVLTIIRRWQVKGPAVSMTPFGGFEDWSAKVRAPIIGLGLPDPCLSMEEIRGDDPEIENMTTFFECLKEQYPVRKFYPALINQDAVNNKELQDAVIGATRKTDYIPQDVGYILKKNANRVLGGLKLARMEKRTKYGHQYFIKTIGK